MQSVYGLMRSPSSRRRLSLFNRTGKPLAILLPALVAGLVQLQALKKSPVWYFFTTNVLCQSPSGLGPPTFLPRGLLEV